MRHRILLSTLLTVALGTNLACAADANSTFDKTLTVQSPATVSIATGSGYIRVIPGSDTQVHIVGHVHARAGWFASDAEAKVKQIAADPPIVQSGNTITVGRNNSDSPLLQDISIDYDIVTPRSTALQTHTGSGAIDVTGIEGVVSAESGSGNVTADNIGANSTLDTGSGSIHATNVHGAASLQTGSGNLQLDLSAPGDVKAQTGSGSIRINGLAGSLRAQTGSGSLDVAGVPASEWRLETGSGSVHIQLGSAAKFTLNAETGSGAIRVEQPILMQGSLNKHHVTGAVNGGGPTIRARTGSGEIVIH
jgi:Putative adhesin